MKKKDYKPGVTILIPAINEGDTLKQLIKDCLKNEKYEIHILILIDSKATLDTRRAAKDSLEKVIDTGKSLGKGAAIKKSIPFITTEYVVQIDADYQFLPNEIPKLIYPLTKGYDVALGTRYQKGSKIEEESVSSLRLIGSFSLSLAASIFAKQRVTDVMAGLKAFKTQVLRDLNPRVNHYGYEAELVIRAAKKHYKIINVPISYKKRLTGNSNVSSIKHGLMVLNTIIKVGTEKE